MIKGIVILGGLIIAGLLIREAGEYAEEVNPFNRYDTGNDFEEERIMIEFANKEDAQGLSIMEMARDIKAICVGIERSDCSSKCELYDDYLGCKLLGNDPSDRDIGEMP